MDEINKERNMQSDREYDSRSGQVSGKSWSSGHWRVWCSSSVSRPACTTRRRFRAQANGWINVENPHLARALHRFSKARNSIRLVLDHSHLLSSRMRGLREILAHPAKEPMGHPKTTGICRLPGKDRIQNNNQPPCPREFLAQPTEFEKSEVLVESRRGAVTLASRCRLARFSPRRLSPVWHGSVSSSRSSHRTCPFRASGARRKLTVSPTEG